MSLLLENFGIRTCSAKRLPKEVTECKQCPSNNEEEKNSETNKTGVQAYSSSVAACDICE